MGKKEFAEALREVKDARNLTVREIGEMVGGSVPVVPSVVQRWLDPNDGWPSKRRWPHIKSKLGVDPSEYKKRESVLVSGDMSQGIVASDNATVTATINAQPGHAVVLSDIEYEIYKKFAKIGSVAMLESCLRKLNAIEQMIY